MRKPYPESLQNVTFVVMRQIRIFLLTLMALWLLKAPTVSAENELKVLAPREFKNILGAVGEFFRGQSSEWIIHEELAAQKDIEKQVLSVWTSDILILSDTTDVKPFLKRATDSGEYVMPFLQDPVVVVANDTFPETITNPRGLLYEGLKKVVLCGKKNLLGSQSRKYLESHQLLESLKDKTIETKDVGSALKLISAGSGDWTFARRSSIARKSGLKIIWSVPPDEIPPDVYSLVGRLSGKKASGVQLYLECLHSTFASKLFENAGYLILSPDPSRIQRK